MLLRGLPSIVSTLIEESIGIQRVNVIDAIFVDVAKLHTTDIIIIFGIIFSVGMLLGLLIILYVKREASNM